MRAPCKITIEVPADLLEKAQRACGGSVAQTVSASLRLMASSYPYMQLRQLRGKVRFRRTPAQLKAGG